MDEILSTGIYEVSTSATDKARRIILLRESGRETIVENCGRATNSAMKLFEGLFTSPIISIKQASKITDIAYKNAANIVTQLENLGILTQTGNTERNRLFRYQSYIKILSEDEEEEIQDIDDTITLN